MFMYNKIPQFFKQVYNIMYDLSIKKTRNLSNIWSNKK